MDPLDVPEEQPGTEAPVGPLDAPPHGGNARRWAIAGAGLLTVIVLVVLALVLGGGSDDSSGDAGDRGKSGSVAPTSGSLGGTEGTAPDGGTANASTTTSDELGAPEGSSIAGSTATSGSSTTSAPRPSTTPPSTTSVPPAPAPTTAGTEVASQAPSPSYPGAPEPAPTATAAPTTTAGVPASVEETEPPPAPPPPDPEGNEPPDGEDPPLEDSTDPNPPEPVGAAIDCFAWSGPAPAAEPPIGDALQDALATMVGRWAGTATVPEGSPPIGDVWFEFYPYGSYTSSCNGPVSVAALGSGGNCACSTNQLRPLTVHEDGSFDVDIDVSWPVDGTDWIAGSTAMTGQLRSVVVAGDVMTFSFVATWDGEVAPITYQLQRVP